MKGNGVFAPTKLALSGAMSEHSNKKKWTKTGLCWKCQEEKSTTGGRIRTAPGFRMFVCKECLEARNG